MKSQFHPTLVVLGTVAMFERPYGFVRPLGGMRDIRIHLNQFSSMVSHQNGFLIVQPSNSHFFPSAGFEIALFRLNQNSGHNEYTIAAAWFTFPYYQARLAQLTHQAILFGAPEIPIAVIQPVPEKKIVSIPFRPPIPPKMVKGEHHSPYREKKRRQWAEAHG
jgi:hypothetical protein